MVKRVIRIILLLIVVIPINVLAATDASNAKEKYSDKYNFVDGILQFDSGFQSTRILRQSGNDYTIHTLGFSPDDDENSYLAFCADPGDTANVKGNSGKNNVSCRALSINKWYDRYAPLRRYLRDTTVLGTGKSILDTPLSEYNTLSNDKKTEVDFCVRLILVYGMNYNLGYTDSSLAYHKKEFVNDIKAFTKNLTTKFAAGQGVPSNFYTRSSGYLGHYDTNYGSEKIGPDANMDDFSDENLLKKCYKYFKDYESNPSDPLYKEMNYDPKKLKDNGYIGTTTTAKYNKDTDTYEAKKYSVKLNQNSSTQDDYDKYYQLYEELNHLSGNPNKFCKLVNRGVIKLDNNCCPDEFYSYIADSTYYYGSQICYNSTMQDLVEKLHGISTTITNENEYIFTVKTILGDDKSKPTIEYKSSKLEVAEFTSWNSTTGTGTLYIKKKSNNKSTEISFNLKSSDNGANSDSKKAVYYCYSGESGGNYQHYITFMPIGGYLDKFKIGIDPVNPPDYDPDDGDCGPAPPFDEWTGEVHNCCEDDKPTKIYQASFDDLFCDLTDDGMYVSYAEVRPDAEDYQDERPINNYCTQYCSHTVNYSLPSQKTRALADRSFTFADNNNAPLSERPFPGVYLNQYRRCRTVIRFDDWLDAYNSTAENVASRYNNYQLAMAKHVTWKNANTSSCKDTNYSIEFTPSCTYDATFTIQKTEYEYKWVDADDTTYNSATSTNKRVSDGKKQVYGKVVKSGPTDVSTSGTGSSTVTGTDFSESGVTKYDMSCASADVKYQKLKTVLDEYTKLSLEKDRMVNYSDSRTILEKSTYDTAYNQAQTDSSSYCPGSGSSSDLSTGYTSSDTVTYSIKDGSISWTYSSSSASSKTTWTTVTIADEITKSLSTADTSRASYNTEVSSMVDLTNALSTCGGYIDENGKKNSDSIMKRTKYSEDEDKKPIMQFSYVQVFVDDMGQIVDQEVPSDFDRICAQKVVTSYTHGSDVFSAKDEYGNLIVDEIWKNDWEHQGYSLSRSDYDTNVYKSGYMSMIIQEEITTSALDPEGTLHHDYTYSADKKFKTDAVAQMTCKWKDKEDNKRYSLIPSGIVVEGDPEEEPDIGPEDTIYYETKTLTFGSFIFRIHNIPKTHAAGKFETYFTLSNIAEGNADDKINKDGTTCSGINSMLEDIVNYDDNYVNASCALHIEREIGPYIKCTGSESIYYTLKSTTTQCNGGGGSGGDTYFEYREVDPNDIFPNLGNYSAWNWKSTAIGQITEKKIEDDAKEDKTYSPDNLTYSFVLTPTDIRAIREYNKSRVKYGGYQDFNMECSMPSDGVGAVTQCKSRFITAISGGDGISMGNGKTLKLNTSSLTRLTELRKTW